MASAPRRPSSLKALSAQKAETIKAAARKAAPPNDLSEAAVEHPGVERWPVKTGTDADAAKVGVNRLSGQNLGVGLVDTTVEDMLGFARASDMPPVGSVFPKNSFYQTHRTAPTETTVWRLRALVTLARLEMDGDYHLVLKGTSGKTMIGEIPNPDPAYVQNPVWRADIKVARDAVDKKLGQPLQPVGFTMAEMAPPQAELVPGTQPPEELAAMTPIGVHATIIGVGFFDSSHGQTGVAPSAIELHPIFSIVFESN